MMKVKRYDMYDSGFDNWSMKERPEGEFVRYEDFEALSDSLHNCQAAQGMSLRDYFAAQAMPELIRDVGDRLPFCEVAQMSYEMADEMIAARKAGA